MDNLNEIKQKGEIISDSGEIQNKIIEAENIVSIENDLEKNSFEYLTLNPENEEVPAYDLGIEINLPKLAKDRINLDPQHGPAGNADTSAIEEAVKYDITTLPEGAKIATIRPDADSVGAMAVLELRKAGIKFDESLVKIIGRVDGLGFKRAKSKYPEVEIRQKELAYANKVCLAKNALSEKVKNMKKLLTNKVDWQEIEEAWKELQNQKEIAKQKLTISPLIEDKDYAVMVSGNHPMALDIGYEKAGIVVAYNPKYKIENGPQHEKWTIARYSEIVFKGKRKEIK